MIKRKLILGATGFVGLNLARRLASLAGPNDELVLADNLSRGLLDSAVGALLAQRPQTRFFQVDLSQPGGFASFEGAFDEVYLLASLVGVFRSETYPEKIIGTNTRIILNTVEWMAASGSRRLFFSSSSENYAGGLKYGIVPIPTPERVPLVIDDITNPRFTYAITKIWGEAAAMFYGKRHGFTSIIGRYHNVYGPRMGYDHVIPELWLRILGGEDPLRVRSTEQTRTFCFISDAVEATRLLMEAPIENGTIVHIGNGREEIKIGELARRLLKLAGREPHLEALPAPRGSVERRAPAVDLLRRLTGFEAVVSLDQGLEETVAWYREHASNKPQGGSE